MLYWLLVLTSVLLRATLAAEQSLWWHDAVFYRLFVDSFKDGNGDGLGDIAGATRQLSYIRALGADAILISPLYTKSKDCTKPGTIDPANLDIRYGTLSHFTELLEKAKKLESRVVLELPLQAMSVASEWFSSSANRSTGYEDWFIWKDGTADQIPEMVLGIDTWVWNENRNAYWGARDNQALLNLCSEGVKAALSTVQCAWLRRGVSGILLTPDFPLDPACSEQLVRQISAAAVQCSRSSNIDAPVIIVETSLEPSEAAKYYGEGGAGANSVLTDSLTSARRNSAPELALRLYADILYAQNELKPTWITSGTGESRIATRYGSEMVDAINLLALILPGSAVIQQGDELGAADTLMEWATPPNNECWPSPMRPAAAPFPWDDSTNGGFSPGEPWLPLAPNFRYANAKTEFSSDSSHAGVVRVTAAMRKSPAIGPNVEITRLGEALAVLRWGGTGSLLLVTNLGRDPTDAQLSRIPGLPKELTVAASSSGSNVAVGAHVETEKSIKLIPGETVLMAGAPRHCGGPGPVDKIANKLAEGWQKINKYFSSA